MYRITGAWKDGQGLTVQHLAFQPNICLSNFLVSIPKSPFQ
ncbi:hypothetical protein RBSWK_00785 [Rhodopirellula baltica SWK14]|uniref:Uncharacterized protein n=1 Tax=Rhodopirellula baltica SWK14 TaxID=993516 RepID=L7CN75_RHOBT|nr:hypothetical protein RBSWK_00785 [Rhodopirellula baltica SWK14]